MAGKYVEVGGLRWVDAELIVAMTERRQLALAAGSVMVPGVCGWMKDMERTIIDHLCCSALAVLLDC